MILSRNKSTHTYESETVTEIAEAITSIYVDEFAKFKGKFIELELLEVRAQTTG